MPIPPVGISPLSSKDGDPLKITAAGYNCTSIESLEFFDTVDGAAVNTNLWNTATSTMTIAQANSFITLNGAASTTANAYSILSTIPTFFLTSCLPLHIHFDVNLSSFNLPANTVLEFGWGTVATNAAPTDGMFFRFANGIMYGVLNNNGTEVAQALAPSPFPLPTDGQTIECVLDCYADKARFFINGFLYGDVSRSVAWPAATNQNRQPAFFRVYNTASVPASSPILNLGQISVQQRNANFDKPFLLKLAGMGRSTIQNPVTTFTQLSNYANSAAPVSATLSNTAAGYTTLGGQWQFAAVAGAETDYALFAYQVPAGYQLFIYDVRVSTFNTGAINDATTPTVLNWGLGVNSSGVSLATADGAGTWKPRRLTLGSQYIPASGAIGYTCPDIVWTQQMPLCIDGGRYLHLILKLPLGVATASQVIRGLAAFNGYFE